ncbi:MAG: ADP-ribosylglycohydrolase family protein [Actinomycetes bacterium]
MSSQNPKKYWLSESESKSKISLGVLAYAAGDAFGVQFEFGPKITGEIVHQLVEKTGWPVGGVSDDTLLSILTIKALHSPTAEAAKVRFLDSMRDTLPQLRGLGPTTRAALGLPVKEVELSQVGYSNGGMMRTALMGFAFPTSNVELRREWIGALVSATHTFPKALDCAQILAAGFSASVETSAIHAVLVAIRREAETNPSISPETKTAIASWESWVPPEIGVSNDSLETLLAVMFVISRATNTRDAYSIACTLGGDTDTVAALAGSLYASTYCDADAFFAIEWIEEVDWIGIEDLSTAIAILIERRSHVA